MKSREGREDISVWAGCVLGSAAVEGSAFGVDDVPAEDAPVVVAPVEEEEGEEELDEGGGVDAGEDALTLGPFDLFREREFGSDVDIHRTA